MKTNLMLVALVALVSSSAVAVPGIIKAGDSQIRGDITYSLTDKEYTISYKRGKNDVTGTYKLGECEIEIEKPKAFDGLVALIEKGNAAGAIGGLDKLVKEYRMLQWDKAAGRYLVEAYLATNNPQKAYDAARDIIRNDESAEWTGDLAPAYWQALMKLGKNVQLEKLIKKAATSGDRGASAAALVMRGDVILNQGGDTPDTLKKALTDAYLRVVLMYADEPCRAARRSALLKAATCFEKLGMASRAEGMRTQAKTM